MTVLGNREARIWVHMVKPMVPDEVHHLVGGGNEIRRYEGGTEDVTSAAV